MSQNKYIFAQLVDFLPYEEFKYIVKKHNGNKGIRDFSCWNQLLMMMFGQLSNCDSMRDLCILTNAHYQKSYRLGFGKSVSLSTLSRGNANRSYRIFEGFASLMIAKAQKCRADIGFDLKVDGNVYAFDSTTISLCLNVFWWATYKRQTSGIKLYTLYDVRTQIPDFVIITPASVNDINGMDYFDYQAGNYYIFDRGYNDFTGLYSIHVGKVATELTDKGFCPSKNPYYYGLKLHILAFVISGTIPFPNRRFFLAASENDLTVAKEWGAEGLD